MGMRVRGLKKADNAFARMEKNMPGAVADTCNDSAKLLLAKSQLEVPRKTNALADTGRVTEVSAGGVHQARGVKYGDSEVDGVGVDYAAAVHEILKASHPQGKAKYVEDPLIQSIKEYKEIGAVNMKKLVKRSFR